MRATAPKAFRAFSLVEVTLALGVAGFCLLAVFGLIPTALNSNQAAIEQTAANSVMTAVISDLRATPMGSPLGSATSSKQYNISIPANPVGAAVTNTPIYFTGDHTVMPSAAQARYRATITFLKNGSARSATLALVKISWPALVDPATATPKGSAQTFVALDRN